MLSCRYVDEAYARMLTCPVYCVLGTNSSYADIDRLSDLFNLIPHNKKFSSFSVGTNVSISLQNFTGAIEFAKSVVAGTEKRCLAPESRRTSATAGFTQA